MVGVAAHIRAASPGGPRRDDDQSAADRRAIENGIWLCTKCGKRVDDDPEQFTVNELLRIKTSAESRARSELELPMRAKEAFNWEAFQLSRVSTYSVPICLRGDGAGSVDNAAFARFNDQLHSMLSYAFGHACVTTPYDEFVYLLSLDHEERTTKPGHIPYVLTLHCHITAFVWAFEEFSRLMIEGSSASVSHLMRSLPGEQVIRVEPCFGRLVPHRIARSSGQSILIQHLADRKLPSDCKTTTSVLLRFLSIMLNNGCVVWDQADKCPDMEKVLSMAAKIADSTSFSWEQLQLDRSNPEAWEFIGER